MTGMRNSLTRTQSDAVAEIVSAESFHIVLETNPPDYVENISRFLESCVGQSGQDKVSNGAAEAESDSGDSLFITQKPVPEAERSGRRRTYTLRSKPASPRDIEESEEDSSSSHDEESKTDKKRRRIKKYKLPEHNFPFLAERKLKRRSTRLPDQKKSLLNYTMGGFFKCVRELRLEPKSSLPTVDTDGEDISPLSEEDKDRSEVEDIKVVERNRLVEMVSPSKAKRQQTWSNPLKQQRKRKASNAGQGTSRGRQTKMLHKNTVKASTSKVVAVSSDTESSDDGESSCRAPVQRERKDQQATSDGNFLAQTGTPKRKRCLVRGDALSLRKASEEDNDATVCEPRELLRRQSTQNGREASTPVTEPQTDAGNETKEKKRKKKKTDKEHHESVEEGKEQCQEEPDNVLRQEEGDIPNSKQKKKKRKKDKSAAENVGQEVDGSLESDVRVEDSNMEDGCKEKKKRKRSGEDVEQLQSSAVAEPLNDDAEIQKKKKKKRKKEEMIVITEEREEEEAANRTLGLPQMSTERLEESGNCLENAAASQETSDSSYVKRKKHKKKRQSSSNDVSQDGDEGEDVSVCLEDSVTSAKGMSQKRKKKTIFEWLNSSYTPDENEKVDNTQEGFEDQNAELVTKKKKKKKKSEIFSGDISQDKVPQSDDSVSVREKKKERTSSFLVADAEENDAQAHGEAEKPGVSAGDLEELNDGVMKKKRKMSVAQDSVVKDHEQDFEEPKKIALTETTDTRVKKKKKRTGSGSEEERLEADAGLSPTEEAVVLKKKKKKKKKKKCKDEQEAPPTASEDVESVALNSCSSVSDKKKGERGRSAEISHDSSTTSDRASEETLNTAEPGNQALNDSRDKKKKKKIKFTDNALLEENSLTESAELESREIKKKERNKQSTVPSIISETSLSKSEMSSSVDIMKNKHRKVKRRLHNPSEDFLSDC